MEQVVLKAALAEAKKRGPKPGKKPIGNPHGFARSGATCATAYKLAAERNRQIARNHAATLAPMVADIKARGIVSVRGIMRELIANDALTMEKARKSGRGAWHPSSVANLLKRIGQLAA